MATFVKKVMARQEEVKFGSYTSIIGLSAYTNTTNRSNMIQVLTPYAVSGITIAQGTGQNDRIGNKVRIKSARLSGVIYPRPYGGNNSSPTPQEVRIWFFTPKVSTAFPTSLPSFFQGSNNNAFAPLGNLIDLTVLLNSDVYTYRGQRTYKIGLSTMIGQSGVPASVMGYTNNDFKYNARFNIDITSMLPKVIKWNDTDNTPYSTPVFFFIETVDADGSSQAVDQTPLEMSWTNTIRYTDI